ncbi:hypothetical protein IQ06DRAFT_6133 [Phaeosphaeriaceae sp. SRC1lsM3a]|nr:hypothetical protein IQ06DRAFT_6133 [Stagonospora sp. SRC1lsM3a]
MHQFVQRFGEGRADDLAIYMNSGSCRTYTCGIMLSKTFQSGPQTSKLREDSDHGLKLELPRDIYIFGQGSSWFSNAAAIRSWFPWLAEQAEAHGVLDCNFLLRHVDRRLKPCIDLSPTRIRDTVIQVFEVVQFTYLGPRTEQVQNKLHAMLAEDIQSRRSSGLNETRETFLVLGSLAQASRSEPLPDAVTGFICRRLVLIVDREKPNRYGHCICGLQEMRGLEDDLTLDEWIAWFSRSKRTAREYWPTMVLCGAREAALSVATMLEALDMDEHRRGDDINVLGL